MSKVGISSSVYTMTQTHASFENYLQVVHNPTAPQRLGHLFRYFRGSYLSINVFIFRIILESSDNVQNENGDEDGTAIKVSHLNLVDLAGSERAAQTGAVGSQLKEGK